MKNHCNIDILIPICTRIDVALVSLMHVDSDVYVRVPRQLIYEEQFLFDRCVTGRHWELRGTIRVCRSALYLLRRLLRSVAMHCQASVISSQSTL